MAGGLRDHLCGFELMRSALVRIVSALTFVAICSVTYAGAGVAIPEAQAAQFCAFPNGSWQLCDEGRAFAECSAGLSRARAEVARVGGTAAVVEACILEKNVNTNKFRCSYRLYAAGVNGPCPGHESIASGYPPVKTCANRSDYNGAFPGGQYKPKSGSISCDLGCTVAWRHNSDGTVNGSTKSDRTCTGDDYDSDDKCNRAVGGGDGYFYNRQVGVCEPKESDCGNGTKPNSLGQCAPEPCPEGMVQNPDGTCKKKDNECPAGNVRSPDGKCLPGDGQCAKGEVRGPDGTCKKDADDDGNPDEPGDKDTFSGGDDCSAPPSCSGSPIMCGQARIQWRIDCNTRKNRNIAGGACNTMPICTGEKCDAMEYSGLLMQWRSACALEKMANSTGNGGENGDLKAIRDALTGSSGTVTLPPDRPASDAWAPGGGKVTNPDTSGYGWGGTCPQPPSIEVFGNSIQINTAPLCNWLFLGGYFVMGLAALASLRIVASKDA
nr:virulence factor TspB C-terminal domain-related protein [Stenotrophomonas geniculata]